MNDEPVALFTADGEPDGWAPRWIVRRDNLWHAATAVLLRHPDGQVYVHRRTPSKDVFPGAYDCWAGGVLQRGEEPAPAAARELAEELGVVGVDLVPLFTWSYSDPSTRYHAHTFEAVYDGSVVHQPEEVDWGGWVPLDQVLLGRYEPFVPDGRAGLLEYLRRYGPQGAGSPAWSG